MTREESEKMIADFIQSQHFAVVSSTWNGEPQAATVAISEYNKFELIFATLNTTRKYRNLKNDPHVAVVVGWDENVTVQYEGIAEETTGDLEDECQKIHLQKSPGSEKYARLKTQRYFKITPKWIRYTDISKDPEFSFEIDF
jgi:uncharacterized protein YhbP (UPF0306 family)